MPAIQEYKCRTCGLTELSFTRADSIGPCKDPACSGELRRKFSIGIQRDLPEHYNPTLGRVISSNREFDEGLKQLSREYTERTGIEANFVRHDPVADAKYLGASGDGIDESNRVRASQGLAALPTPQ